PVAILPALRPRARQHGADLEILVHAQRGKNLPTLRNLADAEVAYAMARQAGDLGPAKADAAAGRAMHAGDCPDQRGLAGLSAARDRHDRSLIHDERNSLEHRGGLAEQIALLDAQHQSASASRRDWTTAGSRTTFSGAPSAIAMP